MASLTLKNVPDELLDRLREAAGRERRSLNQQVLHLLERGVAVEGETAGLKAEARRQSEEWRSLAGRWQSDEPVEKEIQRIHSARTSGREVEL